LCHDGGRRAFGFGGSDRNNGGVNRIPEGLHHWPTTRIFQALQGCSRTCANFFLMIIPARCCPPPTPQPGGNQDRWLRGEIQFDRQQVNTYCFIPLPLRITLLATATLSAGRLVADYRNELVWMLYTNHTHTHLHTQPHTPPVWLKINQHREPIICVASSTTSVALQDDWDVGLDGCRHACSHTVAWLKR
jgi:hypothetical protein